MGQKKRKSEFGLIKLLPCYRSIYTTKAALYLVNRGIFDCNEMEVNIRDAN